MSLVQLGLSGALQAEILDYLGTMDVRSLARFDSRKLRVAVQQMVASYILPVVQNRILPMFVPSATLDQINAWIALARPVFTGLMFAIIDMAVRMKVPDLKRFGVQVLSSAGSEFLSEKLVSMWGRDLTSY